MEEIISQYGIAYYKEPIVSFIFKEGLELGFPEVHELIAQAEKLSGYKPYVILCDMRKNVQVTREGRKTGADKKTVPLKRGTAFLVHAHELEQAADFFNTVQTPDYPFQAFADREEAIKWLLKLPVDK